MFSVFRWLWLGSILALLWACAVAPADSDVRPEAETVDPRHAAAVHFIQPIFSVLDCEKKGEIEAGEIDEHFAELYFFVDRDRSRTISLQEFSASMSHSSAQQDAYLFQQMDTNQDQLVSIMEYRQFVFEVLQVADTDRNGSVDEDEAELHSFRRAGNP
ncbi:MAG: hypothetical protein VYA55_20850 [Pseudomonadota bacterium]|nr:hypothetical protein [Pseudomonadota bacterium]